MPQSVAGRVMGGSCLHRLWVQSSPSTSPYDLHLSNHGSKGGPRNLVLRAKPRDCTRVIPRLVRSHRILIIRLWSRKEQLLTIRVRYNLNVGAFYFSVDHPNGDFDTRQSISCLAYLRSIASSQTSQERLGRTWPPTNFSDPRVRAGTMLNPAPVEDVRRVEVALGVLTPSCTASFWESGLKV